MVVLLFINNSKLQKYNKYCSKNYCRKYYNNFTVCYDIDIRDKIAVTLANYSVTVIVKCQ